MPDVAGTPVSGLDGAYAVTWSPDGRHLVAAGARDDTLVVFERQASDGRLALLQVLRNGEQGITGLDGPTRAVISPDGRSVYAAAFNDQAVVTFGRDPGSGELFFSQALRRGEDGTGGLDGLVDLALSADGVHLYATGYDDRSLAVFRRNPENGTLSFVEVLVQGAGGVSGLTAPTAVAVTPDGSQVVVASASGFAVFLRDSATGRLTLAQEIPGFTMPEARLAGLRDLTFSPDGAHLYLVGLNFGSLSLFRRDPATGLWAFAQVLEEDQLDDAGIAIDGLSGAESVTVSADGTRVLVGSRGEGGSVAVFSRDTQTGTLLFASRVRDLETDASGGTVRGLGDLTAIAEHPDGRAVVVASFTGRSLTLLSAESGVPPSPNSRPASASHRKPSRRGRARSSAG